MAETATAMPDLMKALLAEMQKMSPPAAAPAASFAAPMMTGYPQMPGYAPGQMFGQPMQQMPAIGPLQPTGVSVPITVQLPDGRECQLRIHFGPEHITPQAMPAFVHGLLQQFGPLLKAYMPRYGGGGYGGGYGNGYGNGYGGGYNRGGGYRGRRW